MANKSHTQLGTGPTPPKPGPTWPRRPPFSVGQRYRVEEHLGSGGSALVFGARHQLLGKPVAIKVLRPELAADPLAAQRFLREARLASQLHHENIVDILDFGHDESLDVLYLVMERLSGRTLAEIIRESAPLPWSRAAGILLQLVRALAAAHAQNVVHRDLNPRNIVLCPSSGRPDLVKLCDFGLSRLAGGEDRVTAAGAMVGTPAYMAPEQIRGEETQDPLVDVYAWGATAYEMLTGKLPHEAPTPVALIASKLSDTPVTPSIRNPGLDAPPAVEQLVMRCLRHDPAGRPGGMAEIEQVLLAAGGMAAGHVDLVGQMVGSYRISELVGSGGVGSVYAAEHPLIGSKVAVKVLLPEVAAVPGIVERFIQEARASSEIGSPHIPRYHDFGYLSSGRPYAIMEYLDGETLAERLERVGRLSVAETAALLAQVAEAMAQAHAAGIVHRDLKPENLFLCRGNKASEPSNDDGSTVVKVLDFGVAKMLSPQGTGGKLTSVGIILGTPFYCAPEQALGQDVGPAADIYALGATAFEMLTGRLPFDGTVTDVIGAKITVEPPRARSLRPELPRVVDEALASMLCREQSDRPATMGQVRKAIAAWTGADTGEEPAEAPPPRGRARLWVALAASVVALGASAAFILTRGDARPRPAAVTAPDAGRPPPIRVEPIIITMDAGLTAAPPSPTPSRSPTPSPTQSPTQSPSPPPHKPRPPAPPKKRQDVIIVDPFKQ